MFPFTSKKEDRWNIDQKMQKVNGPGVQLHFNGVNHWLASLKDINGNMYVLDSLKTSKTLNNVVKIQLCQLYANNIQNNCP